MVLKWMCHCCRFVNDTQGCARCGRDRTYCVERPLDSALRDMRPEQLEAFLDSFADAAGPTGPVNRPDAMGYTPLHVATLAENVQCLSILVRRGGLPDASTTDGWRPLHFAAANGNAALAMVLLDAGANPCCATVGRKLTPMHVCTSGAVARNLVSHGASPLSLDDRGRTPMHVAAENGRIDVGEVIIESAGPATLRANDDENWLPEPLAAFCGHEAFVAWCRRVEASTSGRLVEELEPRAWDTDLAFQATRPAYNRELRARQRRESLRRGDKLHIVDHRTARLLTTFQQGTLAVDPPPWLALNDQTAERHREEESFVRGTEPAMPDSGMSLVDEYLGNRRAAASNGCGVYGRRFPSQQLIR